jgi:NADH dehydrogenase FAD-containing subunit
MGCLYAPEDLQVDARRLVEGAGGSFVADAAVEIRPEEQEVLTAGGERHPYDVLSANIGSSVPEDAIPLSDPALQERMVFRTKPIHLLLEARQRILSGLAAGTTRVVVVGCGPAAVELAGNVHRLAAVCGASGAAERLDLRVVCSSTLLSGTPKSFRARAAHSLVRRGIELIHYARVASIDADGVTLESGTRFPADIVLLATGVKPPDLFAASGLATAGDGSLSVNAHLQSTAHPDILGAGDCISFAPRPIRRVGVHAVRQQPILFENIRRLLAGREDLRSYRPQEHYLFALNMGDGTGVAMKWGIRFSGRTAFRVKDTLDRRFIRIYQERAEELQKHATSEPV